MGTPSIHPSIHFLLHTINKLCPFFAYVASWFHTDLYCNIIVCKRSCYCDSQICSGINNTTECIWECGKTSFKYWIQSVVSICKPITKKTEKSVEKKSEKEVAFLVEVRWHLPAKSNLEEWQGRKYFTGSNKKFETTHIIWMVVSFLR